MHLGRLMARNIHLKHEQFRYERWYKLKYSRGSDHPWYGYSEGVMSEDMVKTARMEVDMKLNEYVKQYLNRLGESETPSSNRRAIIRELLFFAERECNFEETKQSIRSMLREADKHAWGEELEARAFTDHTSRPQPLTKLNEISILDSMLQYT